MIRKTMTISAMLVVLVMLMLSAYTPGTTAAQAQATAAATQGVAPVGAPPSGGPGGAPPSGGTGGSTTNPALTSTCGVYTLDSGTAGAENKTYDSTKTDISSACVINAGTLTLTNPTITKTGDTSSSDNSSFYGLNAAVLAGSGSKVTITGGKVTTDGAGTNGVFATGTGSSVILSNVTIKAVGDGAHAVMATLGGTMTLTNVDMDTTGPHSGAIATDRGSGTINVTGGTVTTSGQDSPGIYSTGAITVANAKISSTGAESAVIEGENSITLTNTSLTSSKDNKWGVMIYQSFSGDAEGSKGTFTMTGGVLANTAKNGPLFYVTNSTGMITLKGVNITAASGVLVKASAGNWGNKGSNGGTVIFTADEQTLTGNMVADNISTITATLQNGSSLTGSINADKAAKEVNLTLDASSAWMVTADSYLICLNLSGGISGTSITNIVGNGHTVYYHKSACAALGGKTYTLNGGGTLKPLD